MGKSVAECFPGYPSGYWDLCEVFELVSDMSVFECGVSDARSDNIVLVIPSFSIVTVSVVSERMHYGSNLRGRNFLYESLASCSVAAGVNGGRWT